MEREQPIKVLRIINRFNLGGPTYNVTYLSAYLSSDFETKLIGGAAEEAEGNALYIPHQHGLKPDIIPELQRAVSLKSDIKAYKAIKSIIKTYKPDIVHTHASKAGAVGRLAAYHAKVPIIIHTFHGHVFHSYFGKMKTTFYKAVERYLAKRSTKIIAISKKQKQELVVDHKIAKADKVEVVNLGFDLDRFQTNKTAYRQEFVNDYQIAEDAICIGIIGRLTAVKNHGLFLDVINQVFTQTNKRIHVFVIGDGELRESIENKIATIATKFPEQKISFTLWIQNVAVPLARLDIVCLTSFNEGTPVSLIEAQAANVAVVSTNVGGVEDIVQHGVTGYVVDGLETDEYVSKLLTLIENPSKLAEIKAAGYNFVREKFHYKTLCFNIEQLYLNLLKP
jgi:glycosyltransferase involved in cell wall biosynthesis